jgi:hypothetical protein
MNTAHTVTTAELLNPDSASSGVTNPLRANALSVSKATRSELIRSVMNRNTATKRMARVSIIGVGMDKMNFML